MYAAICIVGPETERGASETSHEEKKGNAKIRNLRALFAIRVQRIAFLRESYNFLVNDK